jgi:hypothetical protein
MFKYVGEKSFGKILVESNLYNVTEKRFYSALHANHRKSIKLCNTHISFELRTNLKTIFLV